jgi:hypothetical protein
MKISSAKLTTCGIVNDGRAVSLDFVDETGTDRSLQLPFDQAQAVAMTLPTLLTKSLKALTGDPGARYAFALDSWTVENSHEHDGLLITLGTADGFQVCFNIPAEACKGLGLTIAGGRDRQTAALDADDAAQPVPFAALN